MITSFRLTTLKDVGPDLLPKSETYLLGQLPAGFLDVPR
jgi:hypothetical protein